MAAIGTLVAVMIVVPSTLRAADDPPVENQVNLQLRIAGLESDSCIVEIKPAHPGCEFQPIVKKVERERSGIISIDRIPILARSTGANRDCSFAITIKEPGQPDKTFRRGMRLTAQDAGEAVPVKSLRIYLSAPELAEREEETPKR